MSIAVQDKIIAGIVTAHGLLVQLFHFMSSESSFTFTLRLNAILSAGWGSVVIGINIYALALLVWLAVRALRAQQGAQADGPAFGGPAP